MNRITGVALLIAGMAGQAFAGIAFAPEIDPGSAVAALSLLSGGVLVLRARKKK